jgi:hypothetical protein
VKPPESRPVCTCGCGCEPDGDWHWNEPRCVCRYMGCECVTDRKSTISPETRARWARAWEATRRAMARRGDD